MQVLEADQHQVDDDDDGDDGDGDGDGDDYPGLEAPSRPSSAYFQLHLHLSALQFTSGLHFPLHNMHCIWPIASGIYISLLEL